MRIDVKSSEAVKVYIGDGDDYIELNPLDVGFPLKIESTYKALDRETEKLKQELIILDKKEDVEGDGLLSRNQKDRLLKIRDYNVKCGQLIDELLGQGTIEKVFKGANYVGMYNDLFEALSPAFKEVYGNPDAVIDRIKQKYSKKDDDVLSWDIQARLK